jgi:protein SCO1/2
MSRLVKFIILAVIGFGLGAGLAWVQHDQSSAPAPQEQAAPAADAMTKAPEGAATEEGAAAPDATVLPDAPAMPAVDGAAATEEGATAAPATEGEAAPAAPAADAAMAPADAGEAAAPQDGMAMEHAAMDHGDAMMKAPEGIAAGANIGGPFTLTDHNGQTVTDKSWPGKQTLVYFGFTNCPDICPVALDKITQALKIAGDASKGVQPLFITVDPARDTPEALKAYLAKYDPSIVGLTGTEDQVKTVRDEYKVFAGKQEGADDAHYLMNHTGYIYLMSEDGKLLEAISGDTTAQALADKIKAHAAAPAGETTP